MFDLRALPADFYDNPYPYYRELRQPIRFINCPTAPIS